MQLDLTINLANVFAIVGGVLWITQRLTRVEERMESVQKDLHEHTEQEEKRFDGIRDRIHEHGDRLHKLDLTQARIDAQGGRR